MTLREKIEQLRSCREKACVACTCLSDALEAIEPEFQPVFYKALKEMSVSQKLLVSKDILDIADSLTKDEE